MDVFKLISIVLCIAVSMISCAPPDEATYHPQYSVPMYYQSSAEVTTYTGRASIDNPGNVDGTLKTARYGSLMGIAFDSKNNLFVVDYMYSTIRKITPSGNVTTFAGNCKKGYADGTGINASFNGPVGLVIDSYDNLYVTDFGNNCIRKITPAGEVTTFAGSTAGIKGSVDGNGTDAQFFQPQGIAIDAANTIYVTEERRIRKITPNGNVTTLAGSDYNGYRDGTGTDAVFSGPNGIVVGPDGNIYVGEGSNADIRKITPSGVVTKFAGHQSVSYVDGVGVAAGFRNVRGMTVDASGNLYVIDLATIRKVTADSVVTMLAGGSGSPFIENGIGCASSFIYPSYIAFDASGDLYVTEECGIRKIVLH